jgi:hypothetical protein
MFRCVACVLLFFLLLASVVVDVQMITNEDYGFGIGFGSVCNVVIWSF